MKKIILLIFIILLTGCSFGKQEKFYLNDKYYNNGEYVRLNSSELEKIKDESMIIYTYNNFCNLPIHCETIFKSFMNKSKIDFVSIPFSEFKKTSFYSKVSFAPSIIVVYNGKVVDYLKADSDSDYDKYQKVDVFEEWLNEFIYFEKTTN